MNRKELEHLIRAAAAITDQYEIMVVGSQKKRLTLWVVARTQPKRS